jgi:hypothetical protein
MVKFISSRFSENQKLNLLLWVIIHTEWTYTSIIFLYARMLVAQHSHWCKSVGPIDKNSLYFAFVAKWVRKLHPSVLWELADFFNKVLKWMVPCAQHQITSTLLHTQHMKVCCCLKLHIYSPHFFISIWMIFFTVLFLFILSRLCKCVALNLQLLSHFHDSWYKHHTITDWLHILILNSLLLVIPVNIWGVI